MQKRSKILIIGPLGEFGGREIETGFIAKTLSDYALVTVTSTIYCSTKSQIFNFIEKKQYLDLFIQLFQKFIVIRILALLSFLKSGFRNTPYFYVNNSLAKKKGFHEKVISILLNQIAKNDLVFICAQLSSTYMKEIVEYCYINKIPVVFRPSNTIKEIDGIHKEWMKKVSLFILHSSSNANRFDFIKKCKSVIIDQCSIDENKLINIKPTKKINKLLFVGRLSEEKGIIELIDFCSKIETISLDIVGDGALQGLIKGLLKHTKNIRLLGYQSQNEIVEYIKQSDALVISSYEESGPLTGLEAMASARIVISTEVGAMKDRLDCLKNQFWFSITNFASFENVINTLQTLSEKQVIEIAIENRKRYQEVYSMNKIATQYKDVINTLLK